MPKVMSVYGFVGRVTASASLSRSVGCDLVDLAALDVEVEHPDFVLVPGDFALAHPERLDLDLVLRAFVVVAALLRRRGCPSGTCRRGSAPSRT